MFQSSTNILCETHKGVPFGLLSQLGHITNHILELLKVNMLLAVLAF